MQFTKLSSNAFRETTPLKNMFLSIELDGQSEKSVKLKKRIDL